MRGLAGIVDWRRRPASSDELRLMLSLIEHRGSDASELETVAEAGLGHARPVPPGSDPRRQQPVWLPDRSCAVVADARLDHRAELRRALGRVEWLREPASDAALILAGYERWREALVERLHGDFAFAIWIRGERRVFAARDPFGARPFFYTASPLRFCFASEPKQLLVLPGVPVEPDARSVAEFLADRMGAGRRTFFRGIDRLRAGHALRADAHEAVQERYWRPPAEAPLAEPSAAAYREGLRELLFDAVERRLGSDPAVCLELSGGLDSSSLVAAAGEVHRRTDAALPVTATISAVFPGREFDETSFIDALAERVPFAGHRITPFGDGGASDLAGEAWAADSPDADLAWAWKRQASAILSALGARVLIAGTGGDELFSDPSWLRDLVVRRRWRLALRYHRSRGGALRPILARSLDGPLLAPARRLAGRGPGSVAAGLGEWLRPEVLAELGGEPPPAAGPPRRGLSFGQRQVLDWLREPRFHYVVEQNEARWGRHGIELRHPFLDRQLVEFVLATPVEVRAAMAGGVKSYLAAALAPLLPQALLQRPRKTAYDGYYATLAARASRRIGERLRGESRWACERYVRRRAVGALLERPSSAGLSWSAVRPLWAVACLEVWLRQLPRYDMIGGDQPVDSLKEVRSA